MVGSVEAVCPRAGQSGDMVEVAYLAERSGRDSERREFNSLLPPKQKKTPPLHTTGPRSHRHTNNAMTQSIRTAGERGSSVAPQSMSELYPRNGEVDEALYIVYKKCPEHTIEDVRGKTAAIVRTEGSITIVTPSNIYPRVQEEDWKFQKLSVRRKRYGTDATTLLKRSYHTGMSRLQGAVCKIDDNITDYLT